MQTITAQAFLKYYKQNYGQGIEQLERLIRQDHVLDLDDFIQAPDQILPDFRNITRPACGTGDFVGCMGPAAPEDRARSR